MMRKKSVRAKKRLSQKRFRLSRMSDKGEQQVSKIRANAEGPGKNRASPS